MMECDSSSGGEDDRSSVCHDKKRHQREDDCWWSIAFLRRTYDAVVVSLIDIDDANRVLPRAATFPSEVAQCKRFALVESKLYAFGCHPKNVINEGSSDFYVCDLKGADFDLARSYEFHRRGRLLAPKPRPIVVPYENEKIFIIATGSAGPCYESVKAPFCEVLRLPSLIVCGIETPFDIAYTNAVPYMPWFDAHFVHGHKLYVRIVADIWEFEQRVFCLDMATEQWRICDDLNFTSGRTAGVCYDDEDAAAEQGLSEPLPSFMASFCEENSFSIYGGNWRCLNYIAGDIMFSAGFALDQPLPGNDQPPPKGKFFARAAHVKDICAPISDTTYFPPLKDLEDYLCDLFPNPDPGQRFFPGWVVPVDLDNKLFCFFMTIGGRLLACKLQLFLKKRIPLKDRGAGATIRPYECQVMGHQFDQTGIRGEALYAFSREGCHRFHIRDLD